MGLLLRVAVLGGVLAACGAPASDGIDPRGDAGAVTADGRAPAIDPGDAAPRGDAAAVVPPGCEGITALSDPRNANADGTAFALAELIGMRVEGREACNYANRPCSRALARFTSPRAARWRLSAHGAQLAALYAYEGCRVGASGSVLRYGSVSSDTGTGSFDVTLAAGQTFTLAAYNFNGEAGRYALRAERIVDHGCFELDTPCPERLTCVPSRPEPGAPGRCVPGTASEIADLRVFTTGVALVRARDADADVRSITMELLDAGGAVVPFRRVARLIRELEADELERELRWAPAPGYGFPPEAVRARVWLTDASGLESTMLDVPVEQPAQGAVGAPCDVYPPFAQGVAACVAIAQCLPGPGGAPVCVEQTAPVVTRLTASVDDVAHELALDFEVRDPDGNGFTADLVYLDAAGREVARLLPFGRVEWRAGAPGGGAAAFHVNGVPEGVARVQLALTDLFGLRSAPVEAAVRPTTAGAVGTPCETFTTARVRCGAALVCARRPGAAAPSCEPTEPACPAAWGARRMTPPAIAGTYALDGTASTTHDSPRCDRPWPSLDDAVEFVAPVDGSYRFRLTAPTAPLRRDFSLSLRSYCGLSGPHSDSGCYWTRETTVGVWLSAGAPMTLWIETDGAPLDYHLEVDVPPAAP